MVLSANVLSLKLVKDVEKTLTQKWFEQMLLFRVQGGTEGNSLTPPHFVSTDLYQGFRRMFRDHSDKSKGMTYVYFGSRRTGKTTAAKGAMQLFLNEFEGKMPCLYVSAGGSSISSALRRVLNVPDTMEDATYVATLCEQLQHFEKDDVKNEHRTCPPIIVIDEITSLARDDYALVDNLFRQVYESRVLLFLLTDSEEIANIFCGMNGRQRIKPLAGMHSVEDGHDDWGIVNTEHSFAHSVAAHIKWHSNNWNRCKLSKMVRLKFPDFDFSQHETEVDGGTGKKAYDFIEDGDLPDDAIEKADKLICCEDPM